MKIRGKLFLTLFLVTGVVTAAVLIAAEYQFRSWVGSVVGDSFQRDVDGLLEARQVRLSEVKLISEVLAAEEGVRKALRGEAGQEDSLAVNRRYLELLKEYSSEAEIRPGARLSPPKGERSALPRQGAGSVDAPAREGRQAGLPRSGRGRESDREARKPGAVGAAGGGAGGQSLPLMAVLTIDGDLRFMGRSVSLRRPRRNERPALQRLGVETGGGEQAVGYTVIERGRDLPNLVQEVVMTPVVDGGERLGWFVLGQDAETGVSRAFAKVESSTGRQARIGLVVNGEWFLEGIDKSLAEALTASVDDDFWEEAKPRHVEVDGEGFLLLARDLNPGSPLGRGYELGVFPLAQLDQAVDQLRWTVAGLGVAGLLVTGLAAWLLSRRFSGPIHALLEGTKRVKEGDFESAVKVSSKDELGALATAFNGMTKELGLKEKYRDVLGKTSDPSVANRLMDGSLKLGGELREVAVMFCDIRGFTAMTEGMPPKDVVDLLNEHMTLMTGVIHKHGGVVDKFVGDLVMGLFGAPVSNEDDLQRAALCAVEMVRVRAEQNARCGQPVQIGVGLASGESVSGLMGSEDRLNYTVMGERVNLASRMCSIADAGEVVVDGVTAARLEGLVGTHLRGRVKVKGFRHEVETWSLETGR